MYRQNQIKKTTLKVNQSKIGETIETKVRRMMTTGEAIKDGAPTIYTDRKDGVIPDYNVRTDRFEIAIEQSDITAKNKIARRTSLSKENTEGTQNTDTNQTQ